MELHLFFDETEFRSIYEEFYESREVQLRQNIKDISRARNTVAVFVFLLLFIIRGDIIWLAWGMAAIVVLLFLSYTEYLKYKLRSSIREGRMQAENFICNQVRSPKVKYTWNSDTVTCYENGEATETWQWSDLEWMDNHPRYLQLHFKNRSNFLIPRKMSNPDAVQEFEAKVLEILPVLAEINGTNAYVRGNP